MSQTTMCYTLNLHHVRCQFYLCKAEIRGDVEKKPLSIRVHGGHLSITRRSLPENEAKTRKQGQEVDTWVQSSLTEGEEG